MSKFRVQVLKPQNGMVYPVTEPEVPAPVNYHGKLEMKEQYRGGMIWMIFA